MASINASKGKQPLYTTNGAGPSTPVPVVNNFQPMESSSRSSSSGSSSRVDDEVVGQNLPAVVQGTPAAVQGTPAVKELTPNQIKDAAWLAAKNVNGYSQAYKGRSPSTSTILGGGLRILAGVAVVGLGMTFGLSFLAITHGFGLPVTIGIMAGSIGLGAYLLSPYIKPVIGGLMHKISQNIDFAWTRLTHESKGEYQARFLKQAFEKVTQELVAAEADLGKNKTNLDNAQKSHQVSKDFLDNLIPQNGNDLSRIARETKAAKKIKAQIDQLNAKIVAGESLVGKLTEKKKALSAYLHVEDITKFKQPQRTLKNNQLSAIITELRSSKNAKSQLLQTHETEIERLNAEIANLQSSINMHGDGRDFVETASEEEHDTYFRNIDAIEQKNVRLKALGEMITGLRTEISMLDQGIKENLTNKMKLFGFPQVAAVQRVPQESVVRVAEAPGAAAAQREVENLAKKERITNNVKTLTKDKTYLISLAEDMNEELTDANKINEALLENITFNKNPSSYENDIQNQVKDMKKIIVQIKSRVGEVYDELGSAKVTQSMSTMEQRLTKINLEILNDLR